MLCPKRFGFQIDVLNGDVKKNYALNVVRSIWSVAVVVLVAAALVAVAAQHRLLQHQHQRRPINKMLELAAVQPMVAAASLSTVAALPLQIRLDHRLWLRSFQGYRLTVVSIQCTRQYHSQLQPWPTVTGLSLFLYARVAAEFYLLTTII